MFSKGKIIICERIFKQFSTGPMEKFTIFCRIFELFKIYDIVLF